MKSGQVSLACCIFLFFVTYATATAGQFDKIDKHALKAPKQAERSISVLAQYLTKPAKTDEEKARSIYRWVTSRIRYDVNGWLNPNQQRSTKAQDVLKNRVCVCEGYAALVVALGKEAGLEVVRIPGKCKGAIRTAKDTPWIQHAWNAVKCNGKWRLMDATWGAGVIKGRKFEPEFDEYYFFTPPDHLIFSHLPEQNRWQLLKPAVSATQWRNWPKVDKELLERGFSPKHVKAAFKTKKFRGFVGTPSLFGKEVTITGAPLTKHIKAGTKLRIRLKGPSFQSVSFVNNKTWTDFKKKGTTFEGELVAEKGTLAISANIQGKGKFFWSVLEYVVE